MYIYFSLFKSSQFSKTKKNELHNNTENEFTHLGAGRNAVFFFFHKYFFFYEKFILDLIFIFWLKKNKDTSSQDGSGFLVRQSKSDSMDESLSTVKKKASVRPSKPFSLSLSLHVHWFKKKVFFLKFELTQ